MSDQLATRIGTVVTGISGGLIAMVVFTPVYAIWPVFAWPVVGGIYFALTLAWCGYLAVSAVRFRRLGRDLPHETNQEDARIAKLQGIVGGIQGGLILTSSVILVVAGLWTWILPCVALIVALHFYAMPWIFRRTIDYYLGTAMLLVAGIGLYLSSQSTAWLTVWGIVGIGGSLVTSAYGLWMVLTARRVLAQYESLSAVPRG